MRKQWNLPMVAMCAFGLTAVAGCGSSSNTNVNQNTDGDVNANVTFPDVSTDSGDDSELISISDEGGITGSVIGGTDQDGSTVTISRIEGTTDEDSFVASFDSSLRTDRVTIGDTSIDVAYGTDDTFTYSVNRGEETVFSGSGLTAIRTDAASTSRATQAVDSEDLAACRGELLASIADVAEQIEASDSETPASAELVACLGGIDSVRQIASALCTVQLVFAPALEEVVLECASRTDPLRCLSRAVPAIAGIVTFYNTMSLVLIDIALQIRRDAEFCSAGG